MILQRNMCDANEKSIELCNNNLAALLSEPLLSLLAGAEKGQDESELDRWFTLEGFNQLSCQKLHDISECFSTLSKLQKTATG